MRLTGSRAYYRPTPPKMPPGLVELIQGLTKDVLKNNPTDIYGFCAGHVQQLLEIRDGPLQKKSLTLEEKITRAQEKIRQRAEKRRQQYDNDLLLQQRNAEGPHINSTSNKVDTPSLSAQESISVNSHKTPIHHEQELVHSSELEVSHNSDAVIITPSDLPQLKNIDEETIKSNEDLENYLYTEAVANEPENKINMVEATNPAIDNDLTTPDIPFIMLPKAKSTDINADMLKNNVSAHKIELNESIKENHELDLEASAVQSMIENQNCVLDDSSASLFGDSAEKEARNIADNVSDEQNSISKTNIVITNDAAQSNLFNLSNNTEETILSYDTNSIQQSIDTNNTKGLTIIENVELTDNNVNFVNGSNEDAKESKTIDISFRESPTMELQDPLSNSVLLETLLETNTDSDNIVTLITQESTHDELNKYESSNAMESDTNTERPEIHKVNTQLDMTIASHEDNHKNRLKQNQINTFDLIENHIITSNENDNIENNDVNSGHATTTNLSESPQISNKDGTNMDLETAAITIQKVFRTFLFKSRASTFDETVNDDSIYSNDDKKEECDFSITGSLNERRPLGLTRMDTVLQTVNEEKSLSLSTDDSSTLSSAATVIQAHVRGFLVRNKLNSNKTISTNSLAASNSNEPSVTSLELDNDQNKNKTVLNIHIVSEGGNYLSRDESLITSMDLSLDSSPQSSINLHPLGYDKSERRKQLKREDAIQSISPPSNNSGKLSEDIDSVKELPLNDHVVTTGYKAECNIEKEDSHEGTTLENDKEAYAENITLGSILTHNENPVGIKNDTDNLKPNLENKRQSLTIMNSDEMDVVTPFITNEANNNSSDIKLMHSGEFHDAVLPTKVSRSDTSVASVQFAQNNLSGVKLITAHVSPPPASNDGFVTTSLWTSCSRVLYFILLLFKCL